jgi:aminoglycoside phosphotransferase (APT) family kinase protein
MGAVAVPRMHDDEVEVDSTVVRRLLAEQLPDLADRPLARVEAWGTDHVIFRLGDDLSVRLPKIGWAAAQGETESRWLPVLAPYVPVSLPVPVAVGRPALGYPYRWYVSPWLPGANPTAADRGRLAGDLAAFVLALQAADTDGAPPVRAGRRGAPLALADASTRERGEALRAMPGAPDVDELVAVWDAGLHAPPWDGPPRWVHGDLSDGNLLVHDGRLSGVIDWGSIGAGDPAVDLIVGWCFFDAASRSAYVDALGFVDEAMWLRARAWAVSMALHALPYYRDTNPDIVARSLRVVREVLAKDEPLPSSSG